MKKLGLFILSILMLFGCTNQSLLKDDKIVKDNVIEIDFGTAHNGIQIELDEETQERLISAYNNIPSKLEYTWDDAGAFGWMNRFVFEGIHEEFEVAYLPLHSAISINDKKYFIPLDCEFYEILFELEHKYQGIGLKFYDDMRSFLSEDGINLLPVDSYAIVSPNVQIDDILKKLEISIDKEYKMSVKEYLDSKYRDVMIVNGCGDLSDPTKYKIGTICELDDCEFKIIEIIDNELGVVLFKYNKGNLK